MQSSGERLSIKDHFYKIGQGRVIPENSDEFWGLFWKEPLSAETIFESINVKDASTIRDQNRLNFVILQRVLIRRIINSLEHLSKSEVAVKETLNCVRILTRVIPVLYEDQDESMELENDIFWEKDFDYRKYIGRETLLKSPNKEKNEECLGILLAKVLVQMLFVKNFTISNNEDAGSSNFWEPGIGFKAPYSPPDPIIDCNRSEILKLLITLCSNGLYSTSSKIVHDGSRFLTVLVATSQKENVVRLICSLLNLACRSGKPSSGDNGLTQEDSQFTEVRHTFVTYAMQFLTIIIVHPLPSSTVQFLNRLEVANVTKPCNLMRYYVGKLNKSNDLVFLASNLLNILKDPLLKAGENTGYFSNWSNSQSSLWALEVTSLFWELMQSNKLFRKLIQLKYLDELFITLLYCVSTGQDVRMQQNLVRISSYFMLYLSSKTELLNKLFDDMNSNFYDSLPPKFKTSEGVVTTRDFLIIHLTRTLITMDSSALNNRKSDLLTTTLVEIIYNLVPPVSLEDKQIEETKVKGLYNPSPRGGLSISACSALMNLIKVYSVKSFLLENPTNADLLALLLRSICNAIIKYPNSSRALMFTALENEKVYEGIYNLISNLDSDDVKSNTNYSRIKREDMIAEETKRSPSVDSNLPSLERMDSFKSDQISLHSNDPQEMTESMFIQSLSVVSSRNSISSLHPTQDLEKSDEENEDTKFIDLALRPKPPTGMSERAKEKLPKDAPLKRTWGGRDSLRILLTLFIPHLKYVLRDKWSLKEGCLVDPFLVLKSIELEDFATFFLKHKSQISFDFLPTTPLEPLVFTWSHISLGWYISLIWGDIFNAIENIKYHISNQKNVLQNMTSLGPISKFTNSFYSKNQFFAKSPQTDWATDSLADINQWKQTNVTLFDIEELSLSNIFGSFKLGFQAVPGTPGGMNEMANSLVKRLSDFRMRNTTRSSIGSNGSNFGTSIDDQSPLGRHHKGSTASLHSLNNINRSRNNTPRSSIS